MSAVMLCEACAAGDVLTELPCFIHKQRHAPRPVVPPATNGQAPASSNGHGPPPPNDAPWTPMPLDGFPPWLREWIVEVSRGMQVPPELPGFMALGALSACVARRLAIDSGNGWEQELTMWLVPVSPSGERKSPVVKQAMRPILEIERRQREAWKDEAAAAKEADADVPPEPGYLVDDVTVEKLAALMAVRGERCGTFSAEGGPLDAIAGRYSGAPALDFWLKAHSGDYTSTDRITRESFTLERPSYVMAVACQPAALARLAKVDGAFERGIFARTLICAPPSAIGRRDARAAPRSKEVQRAYEHHIIAIDRTFADVDNIIQLSPAAAERLIEFEVWIERQMAPGGRFGEPSLRSFAAKAAGHALRTAGCLHVGWTYDKGWATDVADSLMAEAIRWTEWQLAEVERLYPLLLAGVPLGETYSELAGATPAGAHEVLGFLEECGCKMSRRDVFRHFQRSSWCRRVSSLHSVLQWLEDKGEIEYAKENPPGGGSPTWWAGRLYLDEDA